MNLFVGNVDYKASADDLGQLFSQIGEVSSVKIITDKFTGRSKGFGFVEMPNDSEARVAIEKLNGHDIAGRGISVSEARPRETSGGGDRRGGFGGERRQNRDH